jgi:hypothetical protein
MISASARTLGVVALTLFACLVAVAARADTTPTFFKDQRTGCNVGTFTPEPGLSVRWSGPCQNGLAEGSGTVEWLKNGVSTGHSDGAYHSGLREGQFAIANPDGSTSVAAFHNGKPAPVFVVDPASHCSVGTFSNDTQLSVHWSGACNAGKAEGPGIAEWKKAGSFASRSEGTFHGGLLEGRGIKQTSDNYRFEAEFHDGRMNGRCIRTSPAARIDTQCVDDQFNGTGVATFPNGSRYEGEFHDGHMSGRGVFFGTPETGGARLEGSFIDGILNGQGRQVFPRENESYEGNLLNGKYEGTGIYRYQNGTWYEGEWHDSIPNGRGVYHGSGHDFAGTWINGCFAQGDYHAWLNVTKQSCGFD